jgi:hypothetical protein
MNHDLEKSTDEAKRTLGLVIIISMFIAFCLALTLLQWTNL